VRSPRGQHAEQAVCSAGPYDILDFGLEGPDGFRGYVPIPYVSPECGGVEFERMIALMHSAVVVPGRLDAADGLAEALLL
jgi:hypothetical protein